MKRYVLLLALLLVASAAQAQDDAPPAEPPVEQAAGEQAQPPPSSTDPQLVAAGWCVVDSSQGGTAKPADGEGSAGEGGTDELVASGCDAGLGVSLWHYRRLAAVAVVGARTVGAGVAYLAAPRLAVALGVVAPYDGAGIHAGGAQLALGATFSFGGRR